ncbi:MAG: DNRLRE domain-containing protein [candidate division Zixibacteria bacterium]|nr:DNRLRE domain-containing protein [candidate division Zixibacteria bacterium]
MKNSYLFRCSLVIIITILFYTATAYSLGIRNHWMVGQRAIPHLYAQGEAELAQMIESHLDELYCGSMSPDIGWTDNPPISEIAHEAFWIDHYVEVLRHRVSYPFDEAEQREIVFLMGAASHTYGDVPWHGIYDSTAFLPVAMVEDNNSHGFIEYGCDIFMMWEEGEYPWTPDYYWPYDTWVEVYHAAGMPQVTADTIASGTNWIELGITGENVSGWLMYLELLLDIPFSHNNYKDYFPGGINDDAALAAQQMIRCWHILKDGEWAYQHSYREFAYDDAYGTFLRASHPDNNTGAETRFEVGGQDGGNDRKSALIKFELPETPPEPAIHKAELNLYFTERAQSQSADKTLALFEVYKEWGEGHGEDGNPYEFYGSTAPSGSGWATHGFAKFAYLPWDTPGCDMVNSDRSEYPSSFTNLSVSTATSQWIKWDVTNTVREWFDNPSLNNGFILRDQSPLGTEGVFRFASEEEMDYCQRPILNIEWGEVIPVNIAMIPHSAPVDVARGGSFEFTGKLANPNGQPVVGHVWIMLELPDGTRYGPLQQFNNIYMSPGQTIIVPNVTQYVPVFAPEGTYRYVSYAGRYPSTIYDSSYFNFNVIAPLGGSADQWKLYGWFEGDSGESLPARFALDKNYPNPFNAATNIAFSLDRAGKVDLDVYNILGQRVESLVDGFMEAGEHDITWNASEYASGVYFYRLSNGEKTVTKRMSLLK